MIEAESEALRLCPGSTVFLVYERAHFRNLSPQGDTGFQIQCKIWVAEHKQHYTGTNWETAVMRLRNALRVNPPQPCPDEEAPAA
jgi:hypothetical protein